MINLGNEELMLDISKTLAASGVGEFIRMLDLSGISVLLVENETEISFFNRATYEAYKAHPEVKW